MNKLMLNNFFLAGLGGLIGSMLRYGVGQLVAISEVKTRWPVGTILVNLTGCFLIGLIGGLAGTKFTLNPTARVFIVTGVLGGFTTFSAFGIESFKLFYEHNVMLALANISLQVVGGIVLCGAGFRLANF